MRLPHRQRNPFRLRPSATHLWVHFLLLGAVLFRIMEVEFAAIGLGRTALDVISIALYATSVSRFVADRWPTAVILGAGGTAIGIAALNLPAGVLASFLWFAVHLLVAGVATVHVFATDDIGLGEIVDAISIFLVCGLAFANLYAIILAAQPLALVRTAAPTEPLTYDLVVYYSFVTQLTVGYGDILATERPTRALSVAQSLFGVMYLATLVARFVALHTTNSARHRHG